MRFLGWLRSWTGYCHWDWMDDHSWDRCWTCFYLKKRMIEKRAKEPRIPPARLLEK